MHVFSCAHEKKTKKTLALADLHKQAEKQHKQFICYWPEVSLARRNSKSMLYSYELEHGLVIYIQF